MNPSDDKPSSIQGTVKLDPLEYGDESVGKTIGPYKILEKVGEGGCGVVYVAEQTKPVQRRVAIKVIKLGMDTKAVVARFEAERQALAMMDHPNIAKVLDAGATENGRPYFVMELVRGIRITEYCDQNNLTTRERLDLFIKVCRAIQHAHQKGIIHRDIKPSNILVTLHDGVPVPKVIDFGIAKATQGRLTDATVYTQLHEFVGTPAYMSPEQAEMSGLDIDTRSDIYSLGVLLYELLTGHTPFDGAELVSQGLEGMRKTIREKEPARPSTKVATLRGEELTTTARRRSVDRARLLHQLKGDLDWIAMKCLEKDRTRRYESATGLGADVQRHLNNEPVTARPPNAGYRFQKAVRRHKLAVAAAGAVAVALVLGIVATTWQAVRATQAKQEALAASQLAEANERKAIRAQAEETRLRQEAQRQEFAARQRAYASDMNVASQALDKNNLGRALDLLNTQRPAPGQKDLRGWEWRYLWKQTRSDALFTLCQLPAECSSLAVSPDGRWLAAGAIANGVQVWDLLTRRKVAQLPDSEARFSRLAFSPAAPLLAMAGEDLSTENAQTVLRLWNVKTQETVAKCPMEADCEGLSFSSDGRTLVTSTYDAKGHMTVWRVPDLARVADYTTDARDFMSAGTAFAATPDLGLAAYGSQDGRLHVLDLHTGRELSSPAGSEGPVYALAFSPDGKTLASSAIPENCIHLWDAATGKEIGRLNGHDSWVFAMVFWPDGKKLVSASADQTLRIWDLSSRQCLDVLRGNRQEVWRLALLPDEKTLVSACKDGRICFWDTSVTHPREKYLSLPPAVSASFATDSQSILTVDAQGKVWRWSGPDFREKELILDVGSDAVRPDYSATPSERFLAGFSPDDRFLVTRRKDGDISVWDLSRRALQSVFKPPGDGDPRGFAGQGDALIFAGSDHKIHQWDVASQRESHSWVVPPDFGFRLVVSPDERQVVAFDHKGHLLVRDLTGSNPSNRVLASSVGAADIKFAPDGSRLAVASWAGFVHVWDTATWQDPVTLGNFPHAPLSVAFSLDLTRLAAGSDSRDSVKLWDTASWLEVMTLESPGSSFFSAGFSPDANIIAALDVRAGLYLWLAPSWEEIAAAEARDQAEAHPSK